LSIGNKNLGLGKRITQLLSDRKLTVRKAAELANCPVSTIQNWKNDVAPTDFNAVYRLAKAVGVSLSYLLVGECDSATGIEDVLAQDGEILEGVYEIRLKKLRPIAKRGK
jgi:transcriptional regulator with XRE-family HTH domain